jgi:hypothetical protein
MTVSKEDFVSKLLTVLGERKRHSWGAALGFTNNRIHRLFKASEPLPSTEELALIGEAENLNLNWLLYAESPMYRVTSYTEQNAFNPAVEEVLDADWGEYCLLVNQAKCALLASKKTAWEYKGKMVNINKMVCIIGPGNARLQTIANQHAIYGVEIPTYRFEELEAGELGSYSLLGDTRTRGLFDDLDRQEVNWILGNMPLASSHQEVDLICLIDCYNKIQSYKQTTGQVLSDVKVAELTWVMYQTEVDKKIIPATSQLEPDSSLEYRKSVS